MAIATANVAVHNHNIAKLRRSASRYLCKVGIVPVSVNVFCVAPARALLPRLVAKVHCPAFAYVNTVVTLVIKVKLFAKYAVFPLL